MAGLAEFHATMRAAVLDHTDLVGAAADDDDRAFAECGGPEVADLGNFGFERTIQPVAAVPDTLQLRRVDIRV